MNTFLRAAGLLLALGLSARATAAEAPAPPPPLGAETKEWLRLQNSGEQAANGPRPMPGEMADLRSLMVPKADTALNALTNSTVLRVPHGALRKLEERYPAIAAAFSRDGCDS